MHPHTHVRAHIREWVSTVEGNNGGLAQLAERVLSMHEVLGSIPKFSSTPW